MSAPPTVRRMTLVEQLYYQNGCNDPVAISHSYEATVKSEEQAYVRYVMVGNSWVALDFGWVKPPEAPLLLHLHNQGSEPILIGIADAAGTVTVLERIRPNCTRHTEPVNEAGLVLRLEDVEKAGHVKLKVVIIPA